MNYCNSRFIAYLQAKNTPHAVINEQIFWLYQKMIVPLGPVTNIYNLNKEEIKILFSKIPGILIRWNQPLKKNESDWYAVVCSEFIAIEAMPSKLRYQFKKALNLCTVKKINIEDYKDDLFSIYNIVYDRYKVKYKKKLNKQTFYNEIKNISQFQDIIHYWGIFYNNILIGYAEIYAYAKKEANISTVIINPDFNEFLPSYALYYRLCENYLEIEKYSFISDGYKSLLHKTKIQDFLISKLRFKKMPLKLCLQYRNRFYKYLILTILFIKPFIISPKLLALVQLQKILYNQK